ncbi:MAG: type II toxin-antitoxin system VapC family toxin [Armatimonadetes bacterium]|nr:type II toxin-antitoxin system VapC family toxin [Armatimonadota bacterium]
MVYFLDASAVVKYYVTEPGSGWVQRLVDTDEPSLVLAEITIVEVAAAFSILRRVERITSRQRRDFWERFERDFVHRYDLIPVTDETVHKAAYLCGTYPLKAYDAVQLASGIALRDSLKEEDIPVVFVSGDDSLIAASKAEGLAVDNPFWHVDRDV